MLILNLPAVARDPERVQGTIEADDPLWEGIALAFREPLAVDLEGRTVGEGVLVRGRVSGELELNCRRCLQTVPTALDLPVELYYEPLDPDEESAWEGEIYPLPEKGNELELDAAIREQILLNIPQHVLCREECRGLCSQCGANLNETTCACEPETAGSPWDALKKLKFD